jgi:hypothetical protein
VVSVSYANQQSKDRNLQQALAFLRHDEKFHGIGVPNDGVE